MSNYYQLLKIDDVSQSINWRVPNINFSKCKLMYASVNSTWNNVLQNSDFTMTINGTAVPITNSEVGQYNILNFVTMYNALLGFADPNWSCSYSSTTNRLQIVSAGPPIAISSIGAGLKRIFGFEDSDLTLNSILSATNPPNLSLGDVYVNILGLSTGAYNDSNGDKKGFTHVIPNSPLNTVTVYDQLNYMSDVHKQAFECNVLSEYNLDLVGISLRLMLEYIVC